MNQQQALLSARGLTDARDRLITADEPLAELQEACGGVLSGTLAIPELLDLVRQARRMGLRIAREFAAFDGEDIVSGFARITPLSEDDGSGCEMLLENWHRSAAPQVSPRDFAERLDEADRAAAEVTGRLDPRQQVQYLEVLAEDAAALREVEASARQVATVTALVPIAFADVIAALTANVRMTRRIAMIYGGRAGTLGSWRLMRAVMTQQPCPRPPCTRCAAVRARSRQSHGRARGGWWRVGRTGVCGRGMWRAPCKQRERAG